VGLLAPQRFINKTKMKNRFRSHVKLIILHNLLMDVKLNPGLCTAPFEIKLKNLAGYMHCMEGSGVNVPQNFANSCQTTDSRSRNSLYAAAPFSLFLLSQCVRACVVPLTHT
jgi:hypothetical protein